MYVPASRSCVNSSFASDSSTVLVNMMSIKYEMILYWSNEDNAFIVEVPELPGCMADGQTYQEAVANAETVVQEWIETAKELGRPIPEPKGRLMYA
jgi:predicted RNase H-like HicB family nuclease